MHKNCYAMHTFLNFLFANAISRYWSFWMIHTIQYYYLVADFGIFMYLVLLRKQTLWSAPYVIYILPEHIMTTFQYLGR
jgi:hypothetical protein